MGKVPPSKARSFCRAPQSAKLLRLGDAETGVDHWSPAKNHEDTFLIVFFSLVRKERKGQKEESIDSRLGDAGQRSALLNSPTTRYSMGINTYAQHVRRRKI